MTPDPKPVKRIRATPKEWSAIRLHLLEGKHFWCCVCGWRYWNELHHVVPRSQGGDDLAVNLIEVCRECHGRIENRDSKERAQVREVVYRRPATHGYVVQRKSQEWLDRNYPGEA